QHHVPILIVDIAAEENSITAQNSSGFELFQTLAPHGCHMLVQCPPLCWLAGISQAQCCCPRLTRACLALRKLAAHHKGEEDWNESESHPRVSLLHVLVQPCEGSTKAVARFFAIAKNEHMAAGSVVIDVVVEDFSSSFQSVDQAPGVQ